MKSEFGKHAAGILCETNYFIWTQNVGGRRKSVFYRFYRFLSAAMVPQSIKRGA